MTAMKRAVVPVAERLERMSIPEPMSGCILWLGTVTRGYGHITLPGRRFRSAHRVAWELVNGPIPEGLVIDHLCRVRCCINPNHMRVVTNKVNVLCGVGLTARQARQAKCRRGHDLEYNKRDGSRFCRRCKNDWNNRWKRQKKAAARAAAIAFGLELETE